MKLADVDILIVPGFGGSGPDHWQSRWQAKFSSARRVEQADWFGGERARWVDTLVAEAERSKRPTVIVAHSVGAIVVAHAAPRLPRAIAGAFLVAPSDWERPNLIPGVEHDFAPIPRERLPFPSVVVASRNDAYCDFERAAEFAAAWGSELADAGNSGHLNVESDHGPWPEGMVRFATFLASLK
ncbi:MAG TPA: alpha/beta hydrolase [Polyangiaceae bacterium]|nr:alpha/beta hydrolase [Polyangiaceae bacterium]